MKNRFKYYLIMILSCLSLIGIGFASWIVAVDIEKNITGTINVDDVLNGNDYLECTNFTSLKYFTDWFVRDDNKLTDTGTIKAIFKINNKSCKTRFGKDGVNDLNIMLTLSRNNLYIFNEADKMEMGVIIKQGDTKLTCNNTVPADAAYDRYYTSFNIPNFRSASDEIVIEVTYTFKIINSTHYTQTVFSELYRNQTEQFKISARITGN